MKNTFILKLISTLIVVILVSVSAWEQARALDPDHPLLFLYGIIRDLTRRDFDRLGADMTRLMLVNGADSASAIALGRRLREPTQREAALRESADGSRVVWSAAVYQFLDGDDRVIDFLSGLAGTPRQADVGSVLLCACMSPRLLADPRFQAVMVRLGYPAVSP